MKKLSLLFLLSGLLMADNLEFWKVQKVSKNDSLNIREKADYKSKKIASIPANQTCVINHGCGKNIDFSAMQDMEEVEIQLFLSQAKENWCYIEYKNIKGWVNKFYLDVDNSTCR